MSRSQRDKGKRGERELAEALRQLGYPARRGQQYAGDPSAPDIVGPPGTWWECKRRERLNVASIMDQVVAEAGHLVPILAHRRSHSEWLLTIRLDDLPRLVETLTDARSWD